MRAMLKNWDAHVGDAEEVARSAGFQHLRDEIVGLAGVREDDVVVDVGAGTGLLTLAVAPRVATVWAIDVAPAMTEYLRAKAASAGLENVELVTASATSLPLVDDSADVVLSNYCFHHLGDRDKRQALSEARRVLRDGGRLVFGDMMFGVGIGDPRDREVVATKVRAMLRKGPAGIVRLARNGARYVSRRWEHPARAEWWRDALVEAGFVDVDVTVLAHEGGIGRASKPRPGTQRVGD